MSWGKPSEAPRILILAGGFPPYGYGIATYHYGLAKSLAEKGCKVTVITPKKEGATEFDKRQVFKAMRCSNLAFCRELEKSLFILGVVVRHKPKYIFAGSWLDALLCLPWATIFRIPYFVAAHGNELLQFHSSNKVKTVLKRLLRIGMVPAFNHSQRAFPNSEYTKRILLNLRVKQERVVVVPPPAVDAEVFHPSRDIENIKERCALTGKKVIFTAGGLRERKGHDMVLQALPLVKAAIPNLQYLIVGDGPERERLERLTDSLGLNGEVTFTGFIPDDELPKYYNACDVFIMPSREILGRGEVEGFGIVYIEASACGKPVIGGKGGGTSDAILDEETGLLVNPLDEKEIAKALIRLLMDKEYAQKLGERGRERVEKEMSSSVLAQRVLEEMEKATDG